MMYLPTRIKICGLTRAEDIAASLRLGAAYIGLNLWPRSRRALTLERARELLGHIPEGRRVLVDVSTATDVLETYAAEPFDFFQIHFEPEVSLATVAAWAGLVGRERLWLAPRLRPGEAFPKLALEFADTFLIDGYHPDAFGGTGETGDWEGFAELQAAHPERTWILAGGLRPENIEQALAASGAHVVDVCSGVEASCGGKDPERLKAFFARVREAGAGG